MSKRFDSSLKVNREMLSSKIVNMKCIKKLSPFILFCLDNRDRPSELILISILTLEAINYSTNIIRANVTDTHLFVFERK